MSTTEGLHSISILSDGNEIPATYGILDVTVNLEVNKIPQALIVVKDGSGPEQDFEISNEDLFKPGAIITISMGRNGENELVFEGLIIKQRIRCTSEGTLLEIDCRDKAITLTLHRNSNVFEEMSDADCISDLLSGTDVTAEIEGLDTTQKEIVQFNCSLWDFIISRAEANGAWVNTTSGKLSISEPFTNQSTLETYAFGANILEFDAEMDARNQKPKVIAKTWDYSSQEMIETESAEPNLPDQGNLSASELSDIFNWEDTEMIHSGKRITDENTNWANAALLKSRLNKFSGTCKVDGDNRLKPTELITLEGMGNRFNGDALITGVVHSFNAEMAWYTHIQFGLDKTTHLQKYDDVEEQKAAGLLPGVNGLQIGIVTNIHEDPDGEFRVKVKLPVVDEEAEGTWARLSSLDAHKGRGWVCYPEINDEVIVGFLNDDPRDAIVLGRLYSSSNEPHIEPDEENTQKGFLSKSEMILNFNDDTKTIEISTPNGNIITLDEEEGGVFITCENGNKIEMNSDGIALSSDQDITITASGDLTLEGNNVTLTANAQLKGEGSAGAEISSSANTEIKGSLVMIN